MVKKSPVFRLMLTLFVLIIALGMTAPQKAYGAYYTEYEQKVMDANAAQLESYIKNSSTKLYVIDMADIFTEGEEARLTDKCKKASENCKTDIVIITMKTGKDYSEFDTFIRNILEANYGYNGTGTNSEAIIYGIDMVSRADRIITSGRTRSDISQGALDSIRMDAEEDLADGDYYGGCVDFINGVERQMNESFWYKFTLYTPIKLIISAVVSLVSVLVMYTSAKPKMTVTSGTYADPNIRIHRREDRFVNTTYTRRTIESSSGSRSGGGGGGGNSGSSGGHF